MRGSSKINSGTVLTLLLALIIAAIGLQVMGLEYQDPYETEHYNQSQAWCESENGSLALANDAAQAEHNGFHCTANGETYHMHRVADMNYTHDIERVERKCGTTHSNTPLVIGCNLFEFLWPAIAFIAAIVATIYMYTVYW